MTPPAPAPSAQPSSTPPAPSASASALTPHGAQPERTALSWQRSILGTVVGAVLLAMTAIRVDAPWLALGAAALTVDVAVRLMVDSPARALRTGTPTDAWPGLVRLARAVAVLGVLGAVTAVVVATGARG